MSIISAPNFFGTPLAKRDRHAELSCGGVDDEADLL